MLKRISIRTGLLALLAMMTLLLLVVSVMGIIAIQKGNRSLDVINRIQGIELNALYMSNWQPIAHPRHRGAGHT